MGTGEGVEEGSAFLGIMAELVAKHAETAGGVAEALSGLRRSEFFDEEGAEGLVLAVEALVWGEEEGSGLSIC